MFLITNQKANHFSREIILSRQSPASGRWYLHPNVINRFSKQPPFYQRFYLRSRQQNIMTLNFVMVARTLDFLWCLVEGLTNSLVHYQKKTPLEKCPYLVFFWSVFSGISTKSRDALCISPHSLQMRESMDQENTEYGHFSRGLSSGFFCSINKLTS